MSQSENSGCAKLLLGRTLSKLERSALLELSRCIRRSQLAARARIILLAQDPKLNKSAIATKLATSRRTVALWIRKYIAGGLPALSHEKARSGRPSQRRQHRKSVVELNANSIEEEMKCYDGPLRRSQRGLACYAKIPLATLNRIMQREGWRLPGGFIKRQKFVNPDNMLVGVFLDPPFRAIALRTTGNAFQGPRRVDQRLQRHTGELICLLEGLETRLAMSVKAAGRNECLSRFLRGLSNVELNRRTGEQILIYCSHSSNRERLLLDKYIDMPCCFYSGEHSVDWLAGAFSQNGLQPGSVADLLGEFKGFHRLINRQIQKYENSKRGLHRPFRFLAKRNPVGFNPYFGDLVRAYECNMPMANPPPVDRQIKSPPCKPSVRRPVKSQKPEQEVPF